MYKGNWKCLDPWVHNYYRTYGSTECIFVSWWGNFQEWSCHVLSHSQIKLSTVSDLPLATDLMRLPDILQLLKNIDNLVEEHNDDGFKDESTI
jgi:hypothetical protein